MGSSTVWPRHGHTPLLLSYTKYRVVEGTYMSHIPQLFSFLVKGQFYYTLIAEY